MEAPDSPPPRPPGKIDRISAQMRGLVEDLRTWVDLKIKLVELQVEERARSLARKAAVSVAIAGVALTGVVFGLVSLALALGAWWGQPSLGFLAVAVLLLLTAVVVYTLRHRIVGRPDAGRPELEASEPVPQLPEAEKAPAVESER